MFWCQWNTKAQTSETEPSKQGYINLEGSSFQRFCPLKLSQRVFNRKKHVSLCIIQLGWVHTNPNSPDGEGTTTTHQMVGCSTLEITPCYSKYSSSCFTFDFRGSGILWVGKEKGLMSRFWAILSLFISQEELPFRSEWNARVLWTKGGQMSQASPKKHISLIKYISSFNSWQKHQDNAVPENTCQLLNLQPHF